MNWIKIISVIAGDAILTAIVLAIIFYQSMKDSAEGTMLGSSSDFAGIGLIFGAVCGLFTGSVSAAVIIGFQLNMTNAIIFALFFNLFLGGAFYLATHGADDTFAMDFIGLVSVGVINAVIVSKLIN